MDKENQNSDGKKQSPNTENKVENETGSLRMHLFSRTYIPELESDDDDGKNETTNPSDCIDRLDVIRDYEQFISDLDHFIGHLPVVGYDLMGEEEAVLQNAYGIVLGKTFSNHLPVAEDYSLSGLADQLGIEIQC